ncbi:MAG: hypothetical protein PHP54_01705 [Clostridia bacterium]|nr:hypothetical protein [Clostridia bacterium]
MAKKEEIVDKTRYFMEALVYILCIIVVVFANCFGPIYIKMIPLLFILGIVGKVVFNRPVITSVFGFAISLCMLRISGVNDLKYIILSSILMGLYIGLGELCGKFLKESFKYIKNKNKKNKKAVISYSLVIATLSLSLLFHNFINSNFITYGLSKDKLINYITKEYGEGKFDNVSASYHIARNNNFVFIMKQKEDGNNYKFTVYLKDELNIQDGYSEYIQAKKEETLNEKFLNYLSKETPEIKDVNVTLKAISKEEFALEVTKQVETVDNTQIIEYCKQVVTYLNGIDKFEQQESITEVLLNLQSTKDNKQNLTSSVYLEGYRKNKSLNVEEDFKYIQRALKIEYID